MDDLRTYAAFVGQQLIATGPVPTVLLPLKALFDRDPTTLFLIFEDQTGRQVDFDLRGTVDEVLARALPVPPAAGPGRPRLGVVSREVSLLPRHWEWLQDQPNGASACIRRLIDDARKREPDAQRVRMARESVGRFLSAMAGNLPGYEEASRALYAGNRNRFEELIHAWPGDIPAHVQRLSQTAFPVEAHAGPG